MRGGWRAYHVLARHCGMGWGMCSVGCGRHVGSERHIVDWKALGAAEVRCDSVSCLLCFDDTERGSLYTCSLSASPAFIGCRATPTGIRNGVTFTWAGYA